MILTDYFRSTYDADTGYLHEGFNADNPYEYTREWFTWPNSLFAEFVEKWVDEGMPIEQCWHYSLHMFIIASDHGYHPLINNAESIIYKFAPHSQYLQAMGRMAFLWGGWT